MTDTAGWLPEELPASRRARTIAEVLAAPPTYEERQAARAEASRAAEAAGPDTRGFIVRVTGRGGGVSVEEVLARSADAGNAGPSPHDLHRARQLLDEHNLGHCLPERIGAVLDANCGVFETSRRREVPADGDAVLRAESRALDRRHAAEVKRTDDLIRASQASRTRGWFDGWSRAWGGR